MTYLELDYPSQDAARLATALLDEMGITGEWYLRKARGEAWRLSIAAEETVQEQALARLGGKTVEDVAGADGAEDEE